MEKTTVPLSKAPFVWDRLGIFASGLCAVHCLAMPVLFGLFPAIESTLPGDETIHRVLAFTVAGFGCVAFVAGYRRHRRNTVLGLMLAGLAVIFFTSFFADEIFPGCSWEMPLMVVGSLLMITAHYFNRSFCQLCDTCSGRMTP